MLPDETHIYLNSQVFVLNFHVLYQLSVLEVRFYFRKTVNKMHHLEFLVTQGSMEIS